MYLSPLTTWPQHMGISQLLVFWPVGLIVDRQPERRHELARAVGTIGLGAVALLGSALYSDYLPFIYVAMVVLGVFYEGLTSSSETLFADSVQELANEAGKSKRKLLSSIDKRSTPPGPAG